MDENSRNLMLAIGLSVLVLLVWQEFYVNPRVEQQQDAIKIEQQRQAVESGEQQATGTDTIPTADSNAAPDSAGDAATKSENEVLAESPRVEIKSEALTGSINLKGARIDELKLNRYHEKLDKSSPLIELLRPGGSKDAYFAEFGYLPSAAIGELPGAETLWSSSSDTLGGNSEIVLEWTNDKGIRFERVVALDDNYMFTLTDRITNTSSEPIEITPYGRIARFGEPKIQSIFVLHQGLIGVFGEEGLQEVDYDDLQESKVIDAARAETGWIGITDKYWATALVPNQSFKPRFAYFDKGQTQYQADYVGQLTPIAAGETSEIVQRLYAGAKVSSLIDKYESELKIDRFELMIDWGWFHFITKPMFQLLEWLFGIFGNFGVAILVTTVIVKAIFFPLASMSYASMAKMKKVQPEMMQIRERFAEDKTKQQQEMMALYKRERINPAAGCWPLLIQIPVFFALYKVLFVTIEMRHAPFVGWIQDLAAPDPTSLFNLFGLLPYDVPQIMMIGIWPLIMGITMFLQMQMNPAPPDPTQAMIFRWMPVMFTFMLGTFPAGLVIYWAWNNFLSILQQGFIMRRHGTKIELLDNLRAMFRRKPKEAGE